MKHLLFLFTFLIFGSVYSQQLVYTPINPAFGGDTFNYQWLLNSANAQNSFQDSSFSFGDDQSELDQFTQNLNRQLLSQLSRSILESQFGDGFEEGTFNFGSLSLEIFETGEGLVVNILDTSTGEQTQITIPNN